MYSVENFGNGTWNTMQVFKTLGDAHDYLMSAYKLFPRGEFRIRF